MRKSILDISEILYRLINVTAINNLISGQIFREIIPLNDELENIAILVNGTLNERDTGVQRSVAHINILINDFSNGYPQITRFKTISEAVKNEIDTHNELHGKGTYIYIIDETLIKDNRQNQLHYFSIKLKINS